jgi:hypothetical protein
MTTEVRKKWLAEDRACDFHVRYYNKLVAFLRLLPLKHETIMATLHDKIKGVEIPADDIQSLRLVSQTSFTLKTTGFSSGQSL